MEDFIDVLFQEQDEDVEHVCFTRNLNYNVLEGTDPAPDDQAAWYYCVSTTDGTVDKMARRGRANLVAAHVLVLDDIGTKVGEPPLEPTYKLESSEGNFQWGYAIVPCHDLDYYAQCVKQLADAGRTDPGASGAGRLMRLPGSLHRTGFNARLTSWEPERRWALPQLMTLLVPARADSARSDPILDWLEAQGLVVSDTGNSWVDITCPWHDCGGHTNGDGARYSPLGRGDHPDRQGFKCFHTHPDRLEGEPTLGDFLAWVEKQDGPPPAAPTETSSALDLMIERFAVVGKQIADLQTTADDPGELIPLEGFTLMFDRMVWVDGKDKPTSLVNLWKRDERRKVYRGLRTAPGAGLTVDTPHGPYLNYYKPRSHAPAAPDLGVFGEHVQYLCGEHTSLFLDWVAHKLQHPAERAFAIVMMTETFGIGRSMLAKQLRRLFQQGVNELELDEVTSRDGQAQFNDWVADTLLGVIQEAKEHLTDRRSDYATYERVKQLVDPQPVEGMRCKIKHGPIVKADLFANFLIMTNHRDALRVPEGDRRFMVIPNPTTKASDAHYQRVIEWLDDRGAIAAAYAALMQRDVSAYQPWLPPMTEAKADMIELGRSLPETIARQALDSMVGDLVTLRQARNRVAHFAEAGDLDARGREIALTIVQNLWRRLPKLQPSDKVNGGKMRVGEKHQEAVKVLRNAKRWQIEEGGSPDDLHRGECRKNNEGPKNEGIAPLT